MSGPPPALHAELTGLLSDYRDVDDTQRGIAEAMLAFLAARPDALHRSCVPGHFTASAIVVDPSRDAVLLTLHRRLNLWLQMGGHFEAADRSIVDAARREAVEEAGIAGLTVEPRILDVDVHPVTCSLGVPTRHLDIRYLAIAEPGAEPAISAESLDLRWFPRTALPTPLGRDISRLVDLAFARLD
jgi:dehydro coenzyme F420 reductase / coenzyme F420-0:L-glutamate ligase / coenzyme F420-1:gamma-L-glutamate ligase